MNKIILICFLFLTGCTSTVNLEVPCPTCQKITDLAQCQEICSEQFKAVEGTIIFGKEITILTESGINLNYQRGKTTLTCNCQYQ